ncbi:hypothetical protein M011DRAFT_482260 [Sporormia fimetaria CBS 119925]|uniref:Uncharacterized protein n=1 Tax=Sporormia fimetaria CBS 119925 TaxID=1340428 RepID=A0A6A6UTZ3_9PLEO|nr:hypothetical protein M011DRAFT_482260 [Sporormia fimetaria CBS 119925]
MPARPPGPPAKESTADAEQESATKDESEKASGTYTEFTSSQTFFYRRVTSEEATIGSEGADEQKEAVDKGGTSNWCARHGDEERKAEDRFQIEWRYWSR